MTRFHLRRARVNIVRFARCLLKKINIIDIEELINRHRYKL